MTQTQAIWWIVLFISTVIYILISQCTRAIGEIMTTERKILDTVIMYGSLLFLVSVLFNCTVTPIPPNDQTDYPQYDVVEACNRLCANLELHDCPAKIGAPGPDEEFGTIDDVACRPQCEKSVSALPWMLGKARCGAVANDCEAIEACD